MTKQIITGENEKAFDEAMYHLSNGNEKEAYQIFKRINKYLREYLEEEEFVTVFEKGHKDFEGLADEK